MLFVPTTTTFMLSALCIVNWMQNISGKAEQTLCEMQSQLKSRDAELAATQERLANMESLLMNSHLPVSMKSFAEKRRRKIKPSVVDLEPQKTFVGGGQEKHH